MSLAHVLKYYREEVVQISQRSAAYLLNIQSATLSNYEKGTRQIPIDTLRKMKDIYHIDNDTFMAMVLYETTDPKMIKESKFELSQKALKAEDQQLLEFLRKHPSLMNELRILLHSSPAKQKSRIETLVDFLKVAKKGTY
ncbi:helix-turn-helix domain-containing protein [Jeotgalibacillus salarius]|uniref:XRE family transcriptional regulator n=1 Tax=Jeotgalibacillus salarius TaxID=546023 RepID=A0A4Y8LNB6_9BACL|nr:helix-turn-helix transcriptional regulator [Jeotgalibacillus salarius]TFE04083.1 XRE family transcriptional regulator [Jeotgalibacillus salarius]